MKHRYKHVRSIIVDNKTYKWLVNGPCDDFNDKWLRIWDENKKLIVDKDYRSSSITPSEVRKQIDLARKKLTPDTFCDLLQ